MTPKIIAHGGARSGESQEAERRKDVIAACEEGYDVLRKQGAVDAVELAIQRLEASKYLNAGVGSYLQLDGRVRMDAAKFGIHLLGTINGWGGLICIDGRGRIGYAHNTSAMTFHYIE